MNPLISFVLLLLIVLGWTVASEYAVCFVFDLIDYWRRYVRK